MSGQWEQLSFTNTVFKLSNNSREEQVKHATCVRQYFEKYKACLFTRASLPRACWSRLLTRTCLCGYKIPARCQIFVLPPPSYDVTRSIFFPVAAQREACPGFKNWARKALRASDESLRSRHRRELARRWEGDIGNPRVSEPKLGLMAGAVSMARGRVWRALCAVLTRLPSRIDWNSWGALRTWRSPSLFLLALMSPIVLPDQRD